MIQPITAHIITNTNIITDIPTSWVDEARQGCIRAMLTINVMKTGRRKIETRRDVISAKIINEEARIAPRPITKMKEKSIPVCHSIMRSIFV